MVEATVGRVRGDGRVDVHGGGVDLCFPHHVNERAQSQALLHLRGDRREWSPIFLHAGHVTANAEKMSKSTGNFVSLRDALGGTATNTKPLTPRQLRLLLLSASAYTSNLEWSAGAVDKARVLDTGLASFFAEPVFAAGDSNTPHRGEISATDAELLHSVTRFRSKVEACLANDFDFPGVFGAMQQLMRDARKATPTSCFFVEAREAVAEVLELLGFGGRSGVGPAYWSGAASSEATTTPTPNNTDESLPAAGVLDILVSFRSKVRDSARAKDVAGALAACDAVRSELRSKFGVVVQDASGGAPSRWWRA